MNYLVSTFLISLFGTFFVVLRRVHENRTKGVASHNAGDTYWPLNVIWFWFLEMLGRGFVFLKDFSSPHIKKWLGGAASHLYKFSAYSSKQFLQLSNMVHGKGTLKKNTGNTSLFIRDIAEYKKDINR